ncbi:uncharacterized protein METZ01_LOCUS351123 [marine metagenome]|uniref:Uncharacterized protein n=1 Tax=marine metagenome TaxID=408172 RepID=A0A382RKR3_9ZZZZ
MSNSRDPVVVVLRKQAIELGSGALCPTDPVEQLQPHCGRGEVDQAPQRWFNDAAVLPFAEYVDQRWEGQWVEVAAEVPEQQFVNLFAANAGQAADSADADL